MRGKYLRNLGNPWSAPLLRIIASRMTLRIYVILLSLKRYLVNSWRISEFPSGGKGIGLMKLLDMKERLISGFDLELISFQNPSLRVDLTKAQDHIQSLKREFLGAFNK